MSLRRKPSAFSGKKLNAAEWQYNYYSSECFKRSCIIYTNNQHLVSNGRYNMRQWKACQITEQLMLPWLHILMLTIWSVVTSFVLLCAFCFVNANVSLLRMLIILIAPLHISENILAEAKNMVELPLKMKHGNWQAALKANAEGLATAHLSTVCGITGRMKPV